MTSSLRFFPLHPDRNISTTAGGVKGKVSQRMNRGKLLNPLTFHVSLLLVQTLSTTSSIGTLRLKSRRDRGKKPKTKLVRKEISEIHKKTFAVCLLTVKKRITPSCFWGDFKAPTNQQTLF